MSARNYTTRRKDGTYNGSRPVVQVNQDWVRGLVLLGLGSYLVLYLAHNLHISFSIEYGQDRIVSPLPSDYQLPVSERVLVVTATPSPVALPTATPVPSRSEPIRSSVGDDLWATFLATAEEVAPEYDYPLSVLVAQAALESARGTSNFARNRNNFFGMCAYDSDPNQACHYASIEDGIRAYIHNIYTYPRYAKAVEHKDDPVRMVTEIKRAGYASDPLYVEKVTSLPEFTNYLTQE